MSTSQYPGTRSSPPLAFPSQRSRMQARTRRVCRSLSSSFLNSFSSGQKTRGKPTLACIHVFACTLVPTTLLLSTPDRRECSLSWRHVARSRGLKTAAFGCLLLVCGALVFDTSSQTKVMESRLLTSNAGLFKNLRGVRFNSNIYLGPMSSMEMKTLPDNKVAFFLKKKKKDAQELQFILILVYFFKKMDLNSSRSAHTTGSLRTPPVAS